MVSSGVWLLLTSAAATGCAAVARADGLLAHPSEVHLLIDGASLQENTGSASHAGGASLEGAPVVGEGGDGAPQQLGALRVHGHAQQAALSRPVENLSMHTGMDGVWDIYGVV